MIRTRKGSEPGSGSGEVPTDVSAFVNDVPYLTASSMMDTQPAQLAMTAIQPAQLNSAIASVSAQQPSDWNASAGVTRILNKPALFSGVYADLTGKPTLFSGAYSALTGIPATFAPAAHNQAWSTITDRPTTLSGYGITDAASSTALALKFDKPTGTIGQYVRGDGSLATLPTAAARTFTTPSRALNTAFQISTTQDASVGYSVDISVTSVLLAGASGRVFLEYADNAAMTTNLVRVSSSPSATGGVLNVTNLGSGWVGGMIPAGRYVRIRTAIVSGTPTFTIQADQQEVLL